MSYDWEYNFIRTESLEEDNINNDGYEEFYEKIIGSEIEDASVKTRKKNQEPTQMSEMKIEKIGKMSKNNCGYQRRASILRMRSVNNEQIDSKSQNNVTFIIDDIRTNLNCIFGSKSSNLSEFNLLLAELSSIQKRISDLHLRTCHLDVDVDEITARRVKRCRAKFGLNY